jgi:glycosyltransferase involved in cell wall biosynthesis
MPCAQWPFSGRGQRQTPARIGLDARFQAAPGAGIARYTRELVSALASAVQSPALVVFTGSNGPLDEALEGSDVELRRSRAPYYGLREQVVFGRELRAADLDLVHFMNFNHPVAYRGPFILTIPDLTLLSYPGATGRSWLKQPAMRAMVKMGTRRSRRVITVSRHQRDVIARDFGVDPAKIAVTYEAPATRFRPLGAEDLAVWRRERGLDGRFVLYTGQWREYKNVPGLIRAFRLVRDDVAVKLVLVGRGDPAFSEVRAAIEQERLGDDVVVAGLVDDDELVRYYNAAELLVFPSLVEGFGLPPLEAMACGTPVAASNAPPMPEILGDAPVYFDPLSLEGMAAAIRRLLQSPAEREEHARLGRQHAARYTWQRTASETLAVYEEALRTCEGHPKTRDF